MTITGTNFAAGATVTFGSAGGDQRGGSEQHHHHRHHTGGQCRCGDGDGDQPERSQSGSLANGFTYVVTPTVSSVSPNSGSDCGRDGGDDHRDELCHGRDGDVWQCGGDQRGGGEQHDDHGDNAGRQCGSGDGDGDQLSGQSGSLASGFTYIVQPTVSSVSAEQRIDGGRDGGDDHRDELRHGSDGDLRQRQRRPTWWW